MTSNTNKQKIGGANQDWMDRMAMETDMVDSDTIPEEFVYDTKGQTDSTQDVKNEADKILMTGDPVNYVLDVFNTLHIGDRGIGEVLMLSTGSSSVSNCQGLHPKLSGESGKGKSHSCKAMIHLMPAEYVVSTSLSAKAVFYHGEALKPGSVLFSDDVELSPELESIIKRSTSDFHKGVEHMTVNIRREAETLRMAPRIVWWLASVDSELDMQTLNRQIGVDVDDSEATDKLVMEQQLRAAGDGRPEYPETFEVQVCREIFRAVKEHFVSVVIPFHDRIEWRGGENRRNLPVFLDMVKVYALFNYKQREMVDLEDGTHELRATEDDFHSAECLHATRAKAQATKLNAREMKIVDFLAAYGTASVSTISAHTGIVYATTSRVLAGRSDRGTAGLLGKVKELSVSRITREADGGTVSGKEYTLSDAYNRIGSFESVVSLRSV